MDRSWLPPKWDRHRPTIRQLSALHGMLVSAAARIEWETSVENRRLLPHLYAGTAGDLAGLIDDLPPEAGGKGHADG